MKNILLALCLILCFESKAQTAAHHAKAATYNPTPLDRVKNYVQDIADESYSVKTKAGWVIRYRPAGKKNYRTIGRGTTELKAWRDAKNYINGKYR